MTNQENENEVICLAEPVELDNSETASATLSSVASEKQNKAADPVVLSDETETKTSSDFCSSNNEDILLPPPTEFSDRQVDDKEEKVFTVTDSVDTTATSLEVEPKMETKAELTAEKVTASEEDLPAVEPTLDENVNDAEDSSDVVSEETKKSEDAKESVDEVENKPAVNDGENKSAVNDCEEESTVNIPEEESTVNISEGELTVDIIEEKATDNDREEESLVNECKDKLTVNNIEEDSTAQTDEDEKTESSENSVAKDTETNETKLENSPSTPETLPIPTPRVNITIEPRKTFLADNEQPEKKIFDLIKQFEQLSTVNN